MRISDWSSDVCSSDLELAAGSDQELAGHRPISLTQARAPDLRTACVNLPASGTAALTELARSAQVTVSTLIQAAWALLSSRLTNQDTDIGRATCRARVCETVYI